MKGNSHSRRLTSFCQRCIRINTLDPEFSAANRKRTVCTPNHDCAFFVPLMKNIEDSLTELRSTVTRHDTAARRRKRRSEELQREVGSTLGKHPPMREGDALSEPYRLIKIEPKRLL